MKPRLNFGLALASIIVGVSLWMYVRSEAALNVTLQPDAKFMIRYTGLDEEKFVLKSRPASVLVQVEGTLEELDRFKLVKPASMLATVDLSEARPELSTYRVRLPRNDVIDRTGVTIRLLTDEVAIIVEEVVEREMEISLDPYNSPPGLLFSSAKIEPEKVRLRGPLGDLAKVEQVRARVDLSLAINRRVPVTLEAIDRNDRPVESVRCVPSEATVYPQLAKVAPTKNSLVSVVFASGTRPAPGFRLVDYQINPQTVAVRGEMNQLASLKGLSTEPIRLDKLRGSTVIRVRVVAPKGVTLERATTVEVRLRIEPVPIIEGPAPTTPTTTPPVTGGGPP